MKEILMSVNKPHTDNIHSGKKTSELRTRPPKIPTPFKVYMYETIAGGGCGKVVSEWICKDMTEWLMYMGIPAHLSIKGCVSNEHILKYCNNGKKNITEMEIDQASVKVYDRPKELRNFCKVKHLKTKAAISNPDGEEGWQIKRPPQNWCFVKERKDDER